MVRYGKRARWRRTAGALLAAGPVVIVLVAGLTGCTSGTSPANASSDDAARVTPAPHRWCGDERWLSRAAGLYAAVYRRAPRPISARTIDRDLAGGALRTGYRRLTGTGATPDTVELGELRDFLVALAGAEAAGADPVAYTRHLVAVCES
jgi:hypothetical protein